MRYSCTTCDASLQTSAARAEKLPCPSCGGELRAEADVYHLRTDRDPTRRYDLEELKARLQTEKDAVAALERAPASRSPEQVWFVGVQGRQVGPLTMSGLSGLRTRGQLAAHSLVWREGFPSWVAAEAVPELRALFGLAAATPVLPFAEEPRQKPRPPAPPSDPDGLEKPADDERTAPGIEREALAAPPAAEQAESAEVIEERPPEDVTLPPEPGPREVVPGYQATLVPTPGEPPPAPAARDAVTKVARTRALEAEALAMPATDETQPMLLVAAAEPERPLPAEAADETQPLAAPAEAPPFPERPAAAEAGLAAEPATLPPFFEPPAPSTAPGEPPPARRQDTEPDLLPIMPGVTPPEVLAVLAAAAASPVLPPPAPRAHTAQLVPEAPAGERLVFGQRPSAPEPAERTNPDANPEEAAAARAKAPPASPAAGRPKRGYRPAPADKPKRRGAQPPARADAPKARPAAAADAPIAVAPLPPRPQDARSLSPIHTPIFGDRPRAASISRKIAAGLAVVAALVAAALLLRSEPPPAKPADAPATPAAEVQPAAPVVSPQAPPEGSPPPQKP